VDASVPLRGSHHRLRLPQLVVRRLPTPLWPMNAWISRISLILFIVSVALSRLLPSVPGQHWPWYIGAAVFPIVPLAFGAPRLRWASVAALVILCVLIADDVSAGRRFRAQRSDILIQEAPNQIAARNSRGRLSFDASGVSFAAFTFVAGAHPAVRELVRST